MAETINKGVEKIRELAKLPEIKPSLSFFFMGIGIMSMFIGLFMSMYYSPSYKGCNNTHRTLNSFFSISFLLFMIFVGYLLIDNYNTPYLAYIALFLGGITLLIGYSKFFKCSNINTKIAYQLAQNKTIQSLKEHYRKKTEDLVPISYCKNYLTGEFYGGEDIVSNIICDVEACEDCYTSCKPESAKLSDFICASSNQSCALIQVGGVYVSSEMLRAVLIGGARFVDLDIHGYATEDGIIPVVKSTVGNRRSLNHTSFESCLKVIAEEAFRRANESDPLFLHLNLVEFDLELIDRVAYLIVNTFPTDVLLDGTYHYAKSNTLGTQPFCKFFNKIILVVTGKTKNTQLDELVNLHTTYDHITQDKVTQILDWNEARHPEDESDLVHHNRTKFTIIRPNAFSTNLNPEKAWSYGCQFVLMNYANLGNIMNLHDLFFQHRSFVMKSINLQHDRTIVAQGSGVTGSE